MLAKSLEPEGRKISIEMNEKRICKIKVKKERFCQDSNSRPQKNRQRPFRELGSLSEVPRAHVIQVYNHLPVSRIGRALTFRKTGTTLTFTNSAMNFAC